jgi:hypothetical protein
MRNAALLVILVATVIILVVHDSGQLVGWTLVASSWRLEEAESEVRIVSAIEHVACELCRCPSTGHLCQYQGNRFYRAVTT